MVDLVVKPLYNLNTHSQKGQIMLHAILMILLIILVSIIIQHLRPGLFTEIFHKSLAISKKLLKFLFVAGILIGIVAVVYNIYEDQQRAQRSAKYAREQEEFELRQRAEAEQRQRELEQQQEQERVAAEKRQAEYLSQQEKLIALDRYGPDNVKEWDWYQLGMTTSGEYYYVSWNQTKYIYNDRNKKQFWWRIGNNFLHRGVVDCSFRQSRLETISYYDNLGNRSGKGIDYNRPFTPIDNDTIMGDLSNQICRKFN